MNVRFAAAAEIDLEEIGSWLSANAGPSTFKVMRGLRESCRSLCDMPERFPLVPAAKTPVFADAFTAAI